MQRQLMARASSGLPVSRLCLGTEHFGTAVDAATSFTILDRFAEAGGDFLDTAGRGETLVGEWLAGSGRRDRLVVAAKLGRPGPGIVAQVEACLGRLRTDRLDLCYTRGDDAVVPRPEMSEAFTALIARGMVRAFGCSHVSAQRLREARAAAHRLGMPAYECIQQRHTYLVPRAGADFGGDPYATPDLLELVRSDPGLTLLACSPLLSGAYVRSDRAIPAQYLHTGTSRRIAVLHEVAAKVGATPNQVVLAWLLAGDPPALPVLTVSTPRQLDEAMAALELELSPQLLGRLNNAGRSDPRMTVEVQNERS